LSTLHPKHYKALNSPFALSDKRFWGGPRHEWPYRETVKKKHLIELFARISRRSPARAADEIDRLVYQMLKDLRRPSARAPRERFTVAGSTGTKQDRP
jgi:hypothetical protein